MGPRTCAAILESCIGNAARDSGPCRSSAEWRVLHRSPYDSRTMDKGCPALVAGRAAHVLLRLADRLERRAHLRREEQRLFPCREVPALVHLVEVGELRVAAFRPAPG